MINQKISNDDEFYDTNINFGILLNKRRRRIENLEHDVETIEDPRVRGFAYQELLEERQKYFDCLKTDLELQHMVLSDEGMKDEDI